MDKTPTLGKIPLLNIKFNISGLYLVYLSAYGFLADTITGIACILCLYIFYKLATNGSFDNWLTRLVGDDYKLRTAFIIYTFCQFSQINFHNTFENYYDWNLFHVSMVGIFCCLVSTVTRSRLTLTPRSLCSSSLFNSISPYTILLI